MPDTSIERGVILYLRIAMAWIFLYAASHQIFAPNFSVAGFLGQTKTFHGLFSLFTGPVAAPITSALVSYGHLLIGLSLLFGLMTRVSSAFGIALMILYWMAHMDWPYISNTNNFIMDEHLIYAGVLFTLMVKHAGDVWGLDGWAENQRVVQDHPGLKPLFA